MRAESKTRIHDNLTDAHRSAFYSLKTIQVCYRRQFFVLLIKIEREEKMMAV